MRVLTVRQPWAWAIIHGGKDVENRVRNIAGDYRGPVAVHVGLTWDGTSWDKRQIRDAHARVRDEVDGLSLPVREHEQMEPQRGHIIGVIDLIGIHKGHNTEQDRMRAVRSCFQPGKDFGPCSPWADADAWHLELANARVLHSPIPFKGALGMRTLPADVEAAIRQQVAS